MTEQRPAEEWDLVRYLASLGMSWREASTWVEARKEDRTFKANSFDELGSHLDRVWKSRTSPNTASAAMRQIRTAGWPKNQSSTLKIVVALLSAYSFAIWLYVIALQLVEPQSIYWSLAQWLPWLRMDYFGEVGFLASIILGLIWAKLR